MLCLMHEAKPYGHLVVSGRPVTEAQLATLSGFPPDQVTALLAELENAGVFSKNAKGVIYSRRMTRDESKAVKCAKAGKDGGGNPALKGTFKGTYKGQSEVTFDPEARGHIPDIPTKKDSKEVVGSLSQTFQNKKPWTASQKKAAWQSKICNEAQRSMSPENYALFLEAWANDDPGAKRIAEQLSERIKRGREQQVSA